MLNSAFFSSLALYCTYCMAFILSYVWRFCLSSPGFCCLSSRRALVCLVYSFRSWFLAASRLVARLARVARSARWAGASPLPVNSKGEGGGGNIPPAKTVEMFCHSDQFVP